MRILIIGYGKMGQTIAELAPAAGHEVVGIVDHQHAPDAKITDFTPAQVDVAIEFTHPESAFDNVAACLRQKLPVVCGSTGWLHRFEEAGQLVQQTDGALFYASNYSVGVNLFFHFNELMARKMSEFAAGYDVEMTEVHHTQKVDQPSGTALTAAQGILANYPAKTTWRNAPAQAPEELAVLSERRGTVVGIHEVYYVSAADTLTLRHEAHSRAGFAQGALLAAGWLPGRHGVFGMNELLGL